MVSWLQASCRFLCVDLYNAGEAAGLLGLRPDRTRAWLDPHDRHRVRYPPVILDTHTGDDIVTYGEFVELGCLRQHRRCGVPPQGPDR